MDAHEIIRHENKAASRFSAKFHDGIFDLGRVMHFRGDGVHLELRRGRDERTEKNLPASGAEFGLYMMATWASCGTISFNISRYFPAMLACRTVKPVMLPPGRAMLATNPLPIGSDTATNTIGRVVVACISATVTGFLWPRMQSAFSSTTSLASACMRPE